MSAHLLFPLRPAERNRHNGVGGNVHECRSAAAPLQVCPQPQLLEPAPALVLTTPRHGCRNIFLQIIRESKLQDSSTVLRIPDCAEY